MGVMRISMSIERVFRYLCGRLFFFSSRRRHTRFDCDWSSDVCSSDLFWYFLKLGWLAFGGPVGQIGLMHLQVVERQKWLDEEEFVRALNFCHVLPGPEALQLAIYIGYRKGGYAGGALAGVLFILPGFITLTALAFIYVRFGQN